MINALTVRLQNMYIYIFQGLFGFCNFQASSSGFRRLRTNSFSFTLNVEEIEGDFWRLHALVAAVEQTNALEIPALF